MAIDLWWNYESYLDVEKPADRVVAARAPVPELPPSPWRSLGKTLDYTYWEARDRFMELDAILRHAKPIPEMNGPGGAQMNELRDPWNGESSLSSAA